MNILEIEDVIKGLPDQALMQEAQAPSGQMPQFLVVSEIQRRADMRKRFQTQQQEMPQQTVAEQIVSQGIASMGQSPIPLTQQPPQGIPQQGMQPPMPPQGMQQPPMSPPMSPPMMGQSPMQPQGMAAGGVVRMQQGRGVPYVGGTDDYQNLIDQAIMSGGSADDIEALISGNPRAQSVYDSMRGSEPKQAVIPYGEEFIEKSPEARYLERIRGQLSPMSGEISPMGTYGMTREEFEAVRGDRQPATVSDGDQARIDNFLANIEYNKRQRELAAMKDPETDYMQQAYYDSPSMFEYIGDYFSGKQQEMVSGIQDKLNQGNPLTMNEISILNEYGPGFNEARNIAMNRLQEIDVSSIPSEIKIESMPKSVQDDAAGLDETQLDWRTVDAALKGITSEDKAQKDLNKAPSLVAPDSKYDFSSALDILNQISPDYQSLKPDYTAIITEQERRARKIQEDANKEASAQALIQLGAGLAAGDIASGISKAGQAVSDIRGRGRAEAREEEALARKMQLASDEAGMRLGLAEMEANRAIQLERAGLSAEQAKLQAKADRETYEFEKTFGLSENKLLAEVMTELGRSERASLTAAVDQWKALADSALEEDIKAREQLKTQIKSMLESLEKSRGQLRGTFGIEENKAPDTAELDGGFSLVGTRSSK